MSILVLIIAFELVGQVTAIARMDEYTLPRPKIVRVPLGKSSGGTMTAHKDGPYPDVELVVPIAIPSSSKVPDQITGQSTSMEYDRYFRLRRDRIGLREWSRTCLEVQRKIRADLTDVGLTDQERHSLLCGLLLVGNEALQQWIDISAEPDAGSALVRDGRPEMAAAREGQ
ncbi:hypothetical protein AB0M36_02020 [Actinoplanes sp. NPDC051346]|uniref:hypothetical protein n=1 Tax=Actinoplanes sp. NPDC051346 TaxID=3155048 RepID=UPI00342A7449